MNCYRCGSTDLILAPLGPDEMESHVEAGIVLRVCRACALFQNHVDDDEPLTPSEAVNLSRYTRQDSPLLDHVREVTDEIINRP
tara:strand:+ start:1135 stop:1386 length:252 start_codon:yes stop_codon:yes gene_type:complete